MSKILVVDDEERIRDIIKEYLDFEGYTYDDATKTITLNCIEITDEMVTKIKIVKCDENTLQLDFDGEIRIFEK